MRAGTRLESDAIIHIVIGPVALLRRWNGGDKRVPDRSCFPLALVPKPAFGLGRQALSFLKRVAEITI